jgi:hypothetical protein
MILDKHENTKVVGEIYKITNIIDGKCYIGQTRSHRLNHNKYRPFGYLGRFNDHVNEANSNKIHQSKYLNYAILKYGKDNFNCELIQETSIYELDSLEIHYIVQYNSKYPNGYNLTNGGKRFTDISGKFIWNNNTNTQYLKNPKSQIKSDYTKKLISDNLKNSLDNQLHREKMMKLAQKQHLAKKYELYKNVVINKDSIDDYIRVIKNNKNNTQYVRVIINKIKTTFVGKYDTIDILKERARIFILELLKWQHDQIAGNPLEPLLSNK